MNGKLAFFDIDGVVADTQHRDHFAIARDWGQYFSLIHLDGLWRQGFERVEKYYREGWSIAWLTGRREDLRFETKKWLRAQDFPPFPLLMRAMDDRQKLAYLKRDVIRRARLLYPDGVELHDDDPWVIEEANAEWPGAGMHCTWYKKPDSIVRKQKA